MRSRAIDVRALDVQPAVVQPRRAGVVAGLIAVQHERHPRIALEKRQQLMRQAIQIVHRQPLPGQLLKRLCHGRSARHEITRLHDRVVAHFVEQRIDEQIAGRAIPAIGRDEDQRAGEDHQRAHAQDQLGAEGHVCSSTHARRGRTSTLAHARKATATLPQGY